jgi:hypothetical protein
MGKYDVPFLADLGFNEDDILGLKLFAGVSALKDLSWPPTRIFLSRTTDPTEDDARRALCRALRSGKPHRELLMALANAFDPDGESELKVVLRKRSKGHFDRMRDLVIAYKVHMLRGDGKSYGDAVAEVAALLNKSEKHVEKIYGKRLAEVTRFYEAGNRQPASDRRSDAVI